ncbi:MAG: hypothetical protein ABII06_18520 [Pseudomonadota bacterium]
MEDEMMNVAKRVGQRTADSKQPCIWMQAEVVSRKFCRTSYDCPSCRYDRVLRLLAEKNRRMENEGRVPEGKRGRVVPWKDKLMGRPLSGRPCLHHMKGRIEFRACTHEYRCGNCDFDQYFDDQYAAHALVSLVDVLKVGGFKVPQGYYFHRGHTWMKIEEQDSVSVGLDDFALRVLGPFDRIEAPLIGKEVRQGRADITVIRGDYQAGVLSPVSGVVSVSNTELRRNGSTAGKGPYAEGWIMRVHTENLRQDLKDLMIYNETETFMQGEVDRLYQAIEDVAGPLSADGGHLGDDIFGKMPSLGWERLVRNFLKT